MHDIISFLFRALKTTCRCFAPPVSCSCAHASKMRFLITSASAKITQIALEFSPVPFGEYFLNFSQIKMQFHLLKDTFTRNYIS